MYPDGFLLSPLHSSCEQGLRHPHFILCWGFGRRQWDADISRSVAKGWGGGGSGAVCAATQPAPLLPCDRPVPLIAAQGIQGQRTILISSLFINCSRAGTQVSGGQSAGWVGMQGEEGWPEAWVELI